MLRACSILPPSLCIALNISQQLCIPLQGQTIIMAELLLSAFLQVLFDRLASRELLNFANRERVRDLVTKWESKLRNISLLLEDAEDKAMRGADQRVQPWLDDLKDLVYEIEDVVDEFVTQEGIRSSKQAAASSNITRKVCSLLPSCCTDLSPKKFMSDQELRSRIEKIDDRLDFILEQKRDLGLNESGAGSTRNKSYSYDRMTDSLPEHYVVGRQEDERAIIAKLLTETDDRHLSVIPIIGMGGIGKTTLARSVFNNPAVVEAFPKRGWVCVSDNFNIVEIARGLLGSLGGIVGSNDDLNVRHNKLREILSKEKFLIVLDDYWNEDYNGWDRLYNLYRLGVKGSKIIVTTRIENVVSMMKGGLDYHLGELSRDDCLFLLAYHALGVDNFDTHPHLKTIGEKIANKCAGLPLAAKTLGGVLRSKSNTREWEDILNSEIWDLPQGKDGIFPALKLSYFHLPSHLKRCFAFCAIFPQDYEFDRDNLVLLWMAEGLLADTGRQTLQRSLLDHGRQHFDELRNRSFFQHSTQDESRFVMHDLMHDLAATVGGITCLNVGSGGFDDGRCTSPERVRHLSYITERYELSNRLEKCHIFKGLRTFLGITQRGFWNHLSNKVVQELVQKLKHLRALSLSQYWITEIPNCIGHLKHLRFVDFSGNHMNALPESICTLYNLETLILKGCSHLSELPQGMDKLLNLRFLDIRDTFRLRKMPLGIILLHKLEILPKFIVGAEDGLRLKELQHLRNLHGELVISNLQNIREVGDARNAELKAKVNLTTLTLEWEADSGNSSSEPEVLDFLQPHPNIEEVNIYGYGGISFPPWIGSPSLINIKRMRLSGCRNIRALPSLGLLPSLIELDINGMNGVCTVGPEFFGSVERPFPSLQVLRFREMQAWEVWSFSFGDIQIEEPFPLLSKLKLQECPKLVVDGLHQLHSLVELEIKDCPLLKASSSMEGLLLLEDLRLESCNHEVVAGISSINLKAISEISLTSIQGLVYLNGDIFNAVERLEITKCDGLRWLWDDDVESLARVKSLRIESCANLEKLPNNMQRLISLEYLSIKFCSSLESLPDGMTNCNSIEELSIEGCESLVCLFPEGATLPTTLKRLEIQNCVKLERLPEGIMFNNDDTCSSKHATQPQLESLEIYDCPSLKPIIGSNKKLAPSNLKTLTIFDSGAVLDCILEEIDFDQDCNIKSSLHMFTSLSQLSLSGCMSLEVEVFPQLPSSLEYLSLIRCNKIRSLPHRLHTCTNLRVLSLHDLSIESFPEGGLPLSLESLDVGDCKNLRQPMAEWGLHKLTALKELTINGEIGCLYLAGQEMTCFPPTPSPVQAASNWCLLPPNIEKLMIVFQPNIVSLMDGLQGHLTSLRELFMISCPKLRFLPKEGFPPSLEYLSVCDCSRNLERECSKGGRYFPFIERIPRLELQMNS